MVGFMGSGFFKNKYTDRLGLIQIPKCFALTLKIVVDALLPDTPPVFQQLWQKFLSFSIIMAISDIEAQKSDLKIRFCAGTPSEKSRLQAVSPDPI